MYKRLFACVGLLFCAAVALAGTPGKQALSAADGMVRRFADSWNRADGVSYGENYWPEAELVDPSGTIVSGKAAIVREHEELWAGIFRGSHIAGTLRHIQMLGPKYMIVDFDLRLSNLAKPPPGAPPGTTVLNSHIKHVMERRDGVWKVLSAQNTFIAGK